MRKTVIICDKCGKEEYLDTSEKMEDLDWRNVDGDDCCDVCLNPYVEDCNGMRWPKVEIERHKALVDYHRRTRV